MKTEKHERESRRRHKNKNKNKKQREIETFTTLSIILIILESPYNIKSTHLHFHIYNTIIMPLICFKSFHSSQNALDLMG